MVVGEKLYTADEFFEIARLPENEDRRLELENGEIIEMPPSRPINAFIGARILKIVATYVDEHNPGYVIDASGGYKLSDDQVRQPDASFISKERYDSIPSVLEGGPDIAIEVVSPREDTLSKAREYFKAGTKLVWAIYPDLEEIHVLEQTAQRWTVLTLDDVLPGEDVLPGFEVPVKDIFPD